jgi:hypothetical protein
LGAAAAASALSGCFGRWRKERRSVRKFFKHKREAEEEEQDRLAREEKERRKEAEAAAKQAQTTAATQQKEKQLRAQPITARKDQIRGIFGFDPSLPIFKGKNVEEIAKQVHDWGVNAVWTDRKTLARTALVEALHAWQIQVFTTVAMFVGWHERNRPIRADGTPFQPYVPGHWYQGSCPNQPDDIGRKLAEIKDTATHFDVDGVWLDAVRYPTFWETPKPNAEMTCFCPVCLEKFQDWVGVAFPEEVRSVQDKADWILKNREKDWSRFRMECITDITKQCAEVLKKARPKAKLGIFCVPWRRKETRGDEMNAIERIIAQDYPSLAKHADVFSPMVYHKMCGETVEWIGEVTDWVAQETRRPVWPVIQAHGEPRCEWNPYRLSDAEFAGALRAAREGASSGAVVFTLEYLLREKKLEAMAKDFLAP